MPNDYPAICRQLFDPILSCPTEKSAVVQESLTFFTSAMRPNQRVIDA